jgi:transposase
VPSDFGPWQTVWKRHYRWSTDGTYARMFWAVQEAFGSTNSAGDGLVQLLSVDSTSIRVHQHAAGARKDLLAAAAATGGGTELHDSAA